MDYDLAIIGAGWAGFNAAIRAKELGLKTVLIEKAQIGGTCLNRGCIPTKALLQSAKIYSLFKKSASFGIESPFPKINFTQIQARKEKIVAQLGQGMNFLLKGIDFLSGQAQFLSANTIKAGDRQLSAENILIACGSRPAELTGLKFDGTKIISSDDLLNLKEIPDTLLIIGGGVIGCEFAGLFSAFGSKVTIVEKMPQLLPGEDKETASKLQNIFKKKAIQVRTDADAASLDLNSYSLVLLSVGRLPYLEGLGLDQIGLRLEKNRVAVDEYLRTNIPHIYAAGDCTGKIMLAHFAAYQGNIAAENIARPAQLKKADNTVIPSCIFTDPGIASVGLNEESAKAANADVRVNRFDFLGSSMARIKDEIEGFIKIISDKKSGRLLGASIIGPDATELIAVLALGVTNRLSLEQVRETVFAHPTLSEAIGEALKKNHGV